MENTIFADSLSKEIFFYDYINDELFISSLPPFPGYITAITTTLGDVIIFSTQMMELNLFINFTLNEYSLRLSPILNLFIITSLNRVKSKLLGQKVSPYLKNKGRQFDSGFWLQ